MAKERTHAKINIRPAVSVYATYRRLSYKPWYAIAEFVDNSTQNYYDHREELLKAYRKKGRSVCLRIEVVYDHESNTLTIHDNANGMNLEELTRALVLDKPPPDRSGRCEFGMGLKTASCWFGATWMIETSRLGSDKEFVAIVHIPDLIDGKIEEVIVKERPTPQDTHFTRITIKDLYKPIRGRTPTRIRDQLGSIYRQDLRSGEVVILWNGEPVKHEDPPILQEEISRGMTNTWRKELAFKVAWNNSSLSVHGWVGIRIPASQRDAGFALMRRDRVIMGGPGEGYKPMEIFGQGNTFRSQRLVGELHMDDWPVTQAKDAFDWSGGLEDEFIEELKKACQEYMDKAENYRERNRPISRSDMEFATERTREVFSDKQFATAIAQDITFPDPPKTRLQEQDDDAKLKSVSSGPIQYSLDVGTAVWIFRLHWQDQLSDAHWMQVSYPQDDTIDIFLNMAHPFFAAHLDNGEHLELLQKFVMALALAERMARQTSRNGLVSPGDFRAYMNKILRRATDIEADHGN